MHTLEDDYLSVRLKGSAGQSLGAFVVKGITLDVFGDANADAAFHAKQNWEEEKHKEKGRKSRFP